MVEDVVQEVPAVFVVCGKKHVVDVWMGKQRSKSARVVAENGNVERRAAKHIAPEQVGLGKFRKTHGPETWLDGSKMREKKWLRDGSVDGCEMAM